MSCTDPTGEFLVEFFAYTLIGIWTAEALGIIDVRTARLLTSLAFTVASGVPSTMPQAAATGFVQEHHTCHSFFYCNLHLSRSIRISKKRMASKFHRIGVGVFNRGWLTGIAWSGLTKKNCQGRLDYDSRRAVGYGIGLRSY